LAVDRPIVRKTQREEVQNGTGVKRVERKRKLSTEGGASRAYQVMAVNI